MFWCCEACLSRKLQVPYSIYFGLTIYVAHIKYRYFRESSEILYTYLDRPRAYKKDHKGAFDIVPVWLLLA